MFNQFSIQLVVALMSSLLAEEEHYIRSLPPSKSLTSELCYCPMIAGDFEEEVCALNWVSKAVVLSSNTYNINETSVTKYSIFHRKIYRGPRFLPKTLIVPGGECGFTLIKHQTYLLSGLFYGNRPSQLFSSRCLLIHSGDPQIWMNVSPCTLIILKQLQCPKKPSTSASNVTLSTLAPSLPTPRR